MVALIPLALGFSWPPLILAAWAVFEHVGPWWFLLFGFMGTLVSCAGIVANIRLGPLSDWAYFWAYFRYLAILSSVFGVVVWVAFTCYGMLIFLALMHAGHG